MKTPDLIKNESIVRYGRDDVYCNREELCNRISNLTIREYAEWLNELSQLVHHKETNIGLWVVDCDPKDLIGKLNGSQSDAHNLECTQFEQFNKDWIKFCENKNHVESPFFQIK